MIEKSETTERAEFPLTVAFEDGSTNKYEDESDLEMNLEDFDSATARDCRVTDAKGREVHLVLKLLSLERLELKAQ
jgi:hypothetical protein